MKLLALLATAAALTVETSHKGPAVVVNEETSNFAVTVQNHEADAVNVSAVTVSLRTPNKDYRKTYVNYTQTVNKVLGSGETVELPFERIFSVPSRKFDVLFDVTVEGASGTEKSASTPELVQFVDPQISWVDPKFLLATASCLALVSGVGLLVASIVRPDLLETHILTEKAKPKQARQTRKVERVKTPDAPDAWLPAKHKKKN